MVTLKPLQLIKPPLSLPPLLILPIVVYPSGTVSPTPTPVALLGPPLVTVTLKVTVSPALIVVLPSASVVNTTLLAMLKSLTLATVGVALVSSSSAGVSVSAVASGLLSGSKLSLAVISAKFV